MEMILGRKENGLIPFLRFWMVLSLHLPIWGQSHKNVLIEELKYLTDISLLPVYRGESEVAMISSYDTTGGNDDGFSGKYSYIKKEAEDKLLIADLQGPGVIQRIWTPTPTDDTIQFYFDGEKKPRINLKFKDLFSSKKFPFQEPLSGNEVGGYYSYVPIPYKKRCKIVYKGDGLRFHQIQYRTYPKNRRVSSFSMNWSKDEKKAFEKLARKWSQLDKYLQTKKQNSTEEVSVLEKIVKISPGELVKISHIYNGGRIIGITFQNGSQLERDNTDLIFRIKWDDEDRYSINAPMTHFFGYAFGKRAMRSLLLGTKEEMNYCYLPMPFDDQAILELDYLVREDTFQPPMSFQAKIYYTREKRNPRKEGKLYTAWRREKPEEGVPYTILNHEGKGHYIGAILLCQGLETEDVSFTTAFFEGDDITSIDGEERLHGTGSEDYFNGGWYGVADRWDDGFSLPLHGCLDYSAPLARTGGYRFYLGDKVSFSKNYELTIEHGPENNEWSVDYSSLAFYYGDKPPQISMPPQLESTRGFNPPETLEIYLNFFDIQSFGFPFAPMSIHDKRLDGKTVFLIHGEEDWTSVKTKLTLSIEGIYDLHISYFKTPDSGKLRLFQRQEPITEWIDVSSDQLEFVPKQLMGKIKIKGGEAPLTFKTKGEMGKCDFALRRIFLVENKELSKNE